MCSDATCWLFDEREALSSLFFIVIFYYICIYLSMNYLRILRPVIHCLVILSVFFLSYHLRLVTDLIPWRQLTIPSIDVNDLSVFTLLSVVFFLVWWFIRRLYVLSGPVYVQYRVLLKVWMYWGISISFLAYFWSDYLFVNGISRLIVFWVLCLTLLVLFCVDSLWYVILRHIERANPPKALYVYKHKDHFEKLQKTLMWYARYETHWLCYDDLSAASLQEMKVVVMVGDYTKQELQDSFEYVRLAHKSFYHVSESLFLDDIVYKPRNIWGIVALEYKASRLGERERILKRIFDVFVAFFALILFLPLFLVLSIIIKRNSPGPIFYWHERVWRHGKFFWFVKFRSMYIDQCTWADYGWAHADEIEKELENSSANMRKWVLTKIKDDPRVTNVWRWLRRYSLDELPSLWLVLLWDMSLIGPRPHLPHEVEQYQPWQKRLLSIKPGITWYAQIYWRDSLPFEEEARLDLLYIQNRTVLLDVMIIRKTFAVLAKGQ